MGKPKRGVKVPSADYPEVVDLKTFFQMASEPGSFIVSGLVGGPAWAPISRCARPQKPGANAGIEALTVEEVATILKKSRWVVRSLVRQGRLQCCPRQSRESYRFTPEMVRKHLDMRGVR